MPVRLVAYCERSLREVPLGAEGVIVGSFGCDDWRVRWSGYDHYSPTGLWRSYGWQIRPLTDPKADAFIERIKKLGKEPINDAPKVGVTK